MLERIMFDMQVLHGGARESARDVGVETLPVND
jgi:hypothetical protein